MTTQTRRAFSALALASLAAPAWAQMRISTDNAGLIDGMVNVQVRNGVMPAYVARPDARGRFPVIILVSEVFGLHDYIKDVARRLAKVGYAVIAPDFFFRAGDPSRETDPRRLQQIGASANNAQVMNDIGDLIYWLSGQDYAARAIGITGFSWGGAVAWMAMARFRELRAGVVWYGRLSPPNPGEFLGDEDRPWPYDVVSLIRRPVLGLYAGRDQGIPLSDVDSMRTALVAARKRGSDIIIYPDVEHGFHADYRSTYNAQAANDGWARMLYHFDRNGLRPRRYMPGR